MNNVTLTQQDIVTKLRRFWSTTPYGIPRQLDELVVTGFTFEFFFSAVMLSAVSPYVDFYDIHVGYSGNLGYGFKHPRSAWSHSPDHHSPTVSQRAWSPKLLEVLSSFSLTILQSGPYHCLWENWLIVKSKLGQVILQVFTAPWLFRVDQCRCQNFAGQSFSAKDKSAGKLISEILRSPTPPRRIGKVFAKFRLSLPNNIVEVFQKFGLKFKPIYERLEAFSKIKDPRSLYLMQEWKYWDDADAVG